MSVTSIEWTDRTWNPVRGCSRVSEGCRNCYAERIAARFAKPGKPFHGFAKVTAPRDNLDRVGGRRNGWTGRVELVPDKLEEPLRWRDARPKLGRPLRVFVNSMSDPFHEALPDEAIARVLAVMMLAPRHTFQVLTKRPERMRQFLSRRGLYDDVLWHANRLRADRPELNSVGISDPALHPARWIWWGVSVEDQTTADARIPLLLETPAARRFVSYEPGLGPIDFEGPVNVPGGGRTRLKYWLVGRPFFPPGKPGSNVSGPISLKPALDHVIVGGESGPGARPFDVAWARSVVRQCREAGVPVFVKQMGSYVRTRNDSLSTELDPDVPTDWPEPEGWWGRIDENLDGFRDGYQGAPIRIHLTHPKGGDPAEWPEDLRIREFPR